MHACSSVRMCKAALILSLTALCRRHCRRWSSYCRPFERKCGPRLQSSELRVIRMNLAPKMCDAFFRNVGSHSPMDSGAPSHRPWIPNVVFIQTWTLYLCFWRHTCVSWCWPHKKHNYWWRLMRVTNSTHEWSALIVRVNITDDSSCSSGTTIFWVTDTNGL
jgi:hypothetical protein